MQTAHAFIRKKVHCALLRGYVRFLELFPLPNNGVMKKCNREERRIGWKESIRISPAVISPHPFNIQWTDEGEDFSRNRLPVLYARPIESPVLSRHNLESNETLLPSLE
jgi:hypothetical protein